MAAFDGAERNHCFCQEFDPTRLPLGQGRLLQPLDLDVVWSRRPKEPRAQVVCYSDAPSARQRAYMRYAVATARRGWIEPKELLNALSLNQLLDHLSRRAHRPARAA